METYTTKTATVAKSPSDISWIDDQKFAYTIDREIRILDTQALEKTCQVIIKIFLRGLNGIELCCTATKFFSCVQISQSKTGPDSLFCFII